MLQTQITTTNVNQNQNQQTPTMTSREIADLTSKRHDNVKRTIETLVKQQVISIPHSEVNPSGASGGRPSMEYIFSGTQGKRDTTIIVAQLSPQFTARLVDRWTELENRANLDPLLTTPRSQLYFKLFELQAEKEQNQSKVDFVDRLVTRDALMNATQIAQKHGKSAQWLNKILTELDVYNTIIKRGKTFKQWFIEDGLGEMKQSEVGFSQALFTTSGEVWINEMLTQNGYI
ncbi:Rha family transcriptional regulator [Shewanella sp. SE1]|uniref:Rha family transcriptional regulator n=1 Tax=Shewanella sp. SE1 TaxID=2705014 RepID=UPI00138F74E3|nr:Rha family transcriptional regulator [Shewanella sp. SE1]NDO73051.1 DNA-binding protein [Shewanella sp. SE1]